MSLTYESAALRAANYLRAKGVAVEGATLPRLQAMVPDALRALGVRVALSPNRGVREKLRDNFPGLGTFAFVNGVADIGALLSISKAFLREAIRTAELTVASNEFPLQWVPDQTALILSAGIASPFIRYTLQGTKILSCDTTGSLTGLNEQLFIVGNFVPAITDVPFDLEPFFIAILASMGAGLPEPELLLGGGVADGSDGGGGDE